MTVQRESALKVIRCCQAAGVRVVAGGPLFTGGHTAEFPGVDHFVLNEAELTLPPFLDDLARGCPREVYASDQFADLHQTPVPRWELLDLRRYASMSIQFCRGCPFNCDFCNVTALFGHPVRMKSPPQIIAELDRLYALGWREELFFVDDNFIGNPQGLKTGLLPALIAWRKGKRGLPFYTEASINLAADPSLMEMMVAAGFTRVFIGIETMDESCLAECRKTQNQNRNLLEDVRLIQRAGLEVQAGFIVGFDHDRPSIFQRQIEFIQQSGITTAMVGLLQAPPGTRLYERLRREGRLCGESSGDNVDGTTNIRPAMGLEALREGYRRILLAIYSPEPYYERVKTYLRNGRPPRVRTPFRLSDLRAFIHACWRLGIVGRERFCYWKLLLWTKFRRPRFLHQAVTFAIYGYHFRKMCERHVQ